MTDLRRYVCGDCGGMSQPYSIPVLGDGPIPTRRNSVLFREYTKSGHIRATTRRYYCGDCHLDEHLTIRQMTEHHETHVQKTS